MRATIAICRNHAQGARLRRPSEAARDLLPDADIGDSIEDDGEGVVGTAVESQS